MAYFTNRPLITDFRQWTGSNLAEIEAFTALGGATFTLNGDGTLSCYGQIFEVGDWTDQYGFKWGTPAIEDGFQPTASGNDLYALKSELGALANPIVQRKTVPVPAILLGLTSSITVTWDTPMPSGSYDIQVQQAGSGSVVGNLSPAVIVSQSATGCVLSVKALLLVTVGTINLRVKATSY